MQRIYRFEVIEERHRGPENALLHARDSAYGSTVTLCEWTPRDASPADAERLAETAGTPVGTEVFSTGTSVYLAAKDDSTATAALEQLRTHGWFPGEWPGLIAAPPAPEPPAAQPAETKPIAAQPAESVAPPKPRTVTPPTAPRRSRFGIVVMVILAFVAGIIVTAVLWYQQQQQVARQLDEQRQAQQRLEQQMAQQRQDQQRLLDQQQAQQQQAQEQAQLLGTWTQTFEHDARFTGGDHARYHSAVSEQCTITAVPEGYRGEWSETRHIKNLDSDGGFTREYSGTFILHKDGNRVTGAAEGAKSLEDNNYKTDFPTVKFDGTLTGPGKLEFSIIWQVDASGVEINSSRGTLTRQ